MEQLQIRADRFRKQGSLREEDLEEIINGIKENKDIKDNEGDDKAATAATDKHNTMLEAVEEGLLQVHGMPPNTKQQGIFRIMGKNCNGFINRIGGNEKIAKALDIKEDLDIDCLMYCKHHINFRHKDYKNNLKQMFQRELTCTAVLAHNVHKAKCAGRVQEGGTGTISFGDLVGYIKKTGRDDKGLGRWCWVLLGGNNGRNMQIIMAYNPCKNKNVNLGTSYQQQRRYFITKKKDLTCPLILFHKHLVRKIKQWQASGDRIILCMDHNEHVINGPIGKELGDKDGLDLREAVVQHTGQSPGATFVRGSRLINGMWVSSDLEISNACVMPFGYGIGNHCAFILDVPLESLIGGDPVKIVRPVGRRLNSRLPGCSKSYIDSLEKNILRHRLLEQLFDAHTGAYSVEE
jgi:hypothetical protein